MNKELLSVERILENAKLKKMAQINNVETVIGVITASARKEMEAQCRARGADFFLEKNSDWQQQLCKIMSEYISKNRTMLHKALTSGAEDVVLSFFYDSIYLKGIEINTKLYSLRLTKNDIREVTRLVSDIYSREFSKIASSKKMLKKDEIYLKMNTTFNGLVELLVSNRRFKVSHF